MKKISTKRFLDKQAQPFGGDLPGDRGMPPGVSEFDVSPPDVPTQPTSSGDDGVASVDGAIDVEFYYAYTHDPNEEYGRTRITPKSLALFLKKGMGRPQNPAGQEKILEVSAAEPLGELLFAEFEDSIIQQTEEGIEPEYLGDLGPDTRDEALGLR